MVIVPSSDERPIRRMQRAQRCLRGIGFAKDAETCFMLLCAALRTKYP
jgi:hypothetical protein